MKRFATIAYQILTAVAVLIGIVVGYNQLRIWQHSGQSYMGELLRIALICVFALCILGGGALHVFALRLRHSEPKSSKEPPPPSKLIIQSANYAAIEGGGKIYDVTEFMRQIVAGDGLVFDIENHNFVIDAKNFVPHDPKPGKEKRLQVAYSYDNEPSLTIERIEHSRLVLPEDSEIRQLQGEIARTADQITRLNKQHEVNEYRSHQIRDDVLAELRTAKERMAEMEAKDLLLYPRTVFTVQDVSVDEPTDNPDIFYKDKISVIMTNHLDRDVDVWTPVWKSSEVQLQVPWCSMLRIEGPKGWKSKDWGEEHQCVKLPVGRTLTCWIGLLPPVGASIKRRLQMRMPIGTAIFPVKIDGKVYGVPVDMSRE